MFLFLLLHFVEDLSDRELEKLLRENTTSKLFCRFSLTDKTPQHSPFKSAREKIGTQKLSQIFTSLRNQLKSQGYISEVFTFVDTTDIISKATLWKERGRAHRRKYKTRCSKFKSTDAHDLSNERMLQSSCLKQQNSKNSQQID